MIQVDLRYARDFLPPGALEQLQPRLKQAANWLQEGSGAGGEFTGWVHWPQEVEEEQLRRILNCAQKIRGDSEVLVVIGIGGSYLGSRSVVNFLFGSRQGDRQTRLCFAGNGLSSTALQRLMQQLAGVNWSINVISKSGTTTEPAVAFRLLRRQLEQQYGEKEAARRIYVTTDREKGALRQLAEEKGYESFVVPGDIGGRYSVLTPVGLLPIAAAGGDARALLNGAADMMCACRLERMENPAWQYAAARTALYNSGKKIEILASYEPDFHYLAEWWKQLFGESEGKQGRGLFPASVELTADLHSLGQYIQEGERDLLETVVDLGPCPMDLVMQTQADDGDGLNYLAGHSLDEISCCAMEATILAHVAGGVPNILIKTGGRDERSLGALLYFFQYACGLSAYLQGVDPFDQPGVEAYKRNLFALLGKPGYEGEREKIEMLLKKC